MGRRWTREDLEDKIKAGVGAFRAGFGVRSGLESAFPKDGAASSQIGGSGTLCDVEQHSGHESVLPKKAQIRSAGICEVVFTVYRRRLADYSRANSEKAYIDALQYAGCFSNDSEKEIRLKDGGQHKVETQEEERVEIELRYEGVDLDNLFEFTDW